MNKIKMILIILIILNVIAFVYFLIIPKVEKLDYNSYAMEQEFLRVGTDKINDTDKKTAILQIDNQNIVKENYKGEIYLSNVNLKIQDLIEGGFKQMYEDTKGFNYDQFANYLKNNNNDIAMKTGITDVNDLIGFIEKIQVYKNTSLEFEKAKIVENSYVNGKKYDNFSIELDYKNGQSITFKVYLSNKDFIDTPIIVIK